MSIEKVIPRNEVVTLWHNTALVAGPIFTAFFNGKENRAVPIDENFVASHSTTYSSISLSRFDSDGLRSHVNFRIPRNRVQSLDLWDAQRMCVPCTYNTVAIFQMTLTVIIDDVQEACVAMSTHQRPKDGVELPQSFYHLTQRTTEVLY